MGPVNVASRHSGEVARFLGVCLIVLLFALADGEQAQACSAGSSVVVDGRSLGGMGRFNREELPPADGTVDGTFPGVCGSETTHAKVQRLDGVSPRVAVTAGAGKELYVAGESLFVLAEHPLHSVFFAPGDVRDPAPCPDAPERRITVNSAGFSLLKPRGQIALRVWPHARIVNRPAETPIFPGQRLRVAVGRCHRHASAERITFIGPDAMPVAYGAGAAGQSGNTDEGGLPGVAYVVIALGSLGLVTMLGAAVFVTRGLRRS